MEELWRPVPSLLGVYEASSLGNIRRTANGRLLKPRLSKGYLRVAPFVNGRQPNRSVHRLIAETFLGCMPADMQINHINGVKTDNRPENLEVCTASHNCSHRANTLRRQNPFPVLVGQENGRAKLKDTDVPVIRAMKAAGVSQTKIAAHFGVGQSTISRLMLGRTQFKTE
jgi:hypothetical protein